MSIKLVVAGVPAVLSALVVTSMAHANTVDFGNTVENGTAFDSSETLLGNSFSPLTQGSITEEISHLLPCNSLFGCGAYTYYQSAVTDPFTLDILFLTPYTASYTISGASAARISSVGLYSNGQLVKSGMIYGNDGVAFTIGGTPFVTNGPGVTLQAGQQYDFRFSSSLVGDAAEVDGTIFFPTAAPEPAAWALMALGIGGVGVAMRNSKRRRVQAVLP